MSESTKTTLSESATDIESGVPRERFIRGRWQVGIFDCSHHCIPNGWMACFCPCVSLAQISARFEPGSFGYVLIKHLVLHLLDVGVLVACILIPIEIKENIEKKKTLSRDDLRIPVIKLLGCVILMLIVGWLTTRTITKLRTRVRERFRIPGSEEDDNMQASCCGKCVIAQMATQVKSYKPGSCGFSKPDELPAFIY